MYKILVANQKGRCGKTSIATNLATALAYRACDNQKYFWRTLIGKNLAYAG